MPNGTAKTMSLCLAFGMVIAGCAEHRISLAQFLIKQRLAADAPRQPLAPEAMQELNQQLGPYRIGPGDVLQVTITDTRAFANRGAAVVSPYRVRVDRDGTIELPGIAAIRVADRELEDAEDLICAACIPSLYREASCHVDVETPGTTDVLVVGAVALPGLVPLKRTERNLLFAIVGVRIEERP